MQSEADAIAHGLPWLLVDSFSPGDVMSRVMGELLSDNQHRPRSLLLIIRQVELIVCTIIGVIVV
jgi:hypothetical protein